MISWSNPVRLTGRNGNEKYVKLTVSNTTIKVSNRGEYLGDNIIANAYLKGITEDFTIEWSNSLSLENFFIATEQDNIKELQNNILNADSVTITVTVVHKGVTYTDSMTIDRVFETTSPNEHLGIKTDYPIVTDNGKALANGDSFVLKTANDDDFDYVPYVFDGVSWIQTTDANGNVLPKYANILMQSATSILDNNIDVKESSAAIWGWFKNLVATNAVIENLITKNLDVAGGLFQFRAKTHDSSGNVLTNPIFDVIYNGSTIFSIDAVSGNVNIGDDGQGNPLFYYKQSTKSIRSKNDRFIIASDGSLIANNITVNYGSFSGTLESVQGLFKGQFETAVLKTQMGNDSNFGINAPNSKYQAQTVVNAMHYEGLVDGRIYPCSISEYPEYTSLYFNRDYGTQEFYRARFFRSDGTYYDIETIIGWGSTTGTFLPSTLTISVIIGGDELYMIDLPSVKPTQSNRVWKDGEYLKIT